MRLRFAVVLLPILAALAFASCSNEGQGQPCDPLAGNSGDDDCQSGLVCTPTSNAGSRCCPQNRQTATAPECVLSSTTTDAASPTPPVDAGSESSPLDAPSEAVVEAEAETGPASDASDGSASEASTTDAPAE